MPREPSCEQWLDVDSTPDSVTGEVETAGTRATPEQHGQKPTTQVLICVSEYELAVPKLVGSAELNESER